MRTDDPVVLSHFTDASSIDQHRDKDHDVVTADGIILGYRWLIDHDRRLKITLSSCYGCHSRVMPDGSVLAGAPRNHTLATNPAVERILRPLRQGERPAGEDLYSQFGVPWREDDIHRRFLSMSPSDFGEFFRLDNGSPPGSTFDRFNGSPFFTTRASDLRGIADRRFLDATATHRNRGPADLARYGILVEYADEGVFGEHRLIPEGAVPNMLRPTDEAMYALGHYLYSLEVPTSPHPLDESARRGRQIFADEGCSECHTPPLYSNNKLVRVPGFERAEGDTRATGLPVMQRRVDTDPGLALRTRKGTGYYKVPSLRGLWYRGLYEHSGSVRTLADWFDSKRLDPDYVPTGWRGPGVERRAVVGHEFGLDLDAEDKAALVAFLQTL